MDESNPTSQVDLSLVIGTSGHTVDMHHSSTTFSGVADVIATIGDAAITGELKKTRLTDSPIRAELQTSFDSSYGQNFALKVKGEELVSALNNLGRKTLCEIINYFVMESLFLDSPDLTPRAQEKINDMADIHDEIIAKLRHPLKRMHKVSEAYGYNVFFNHRVEGEQRQFLAISEETAANLKPIRVDAAEEEYSVAISRFNHLTGNGRLFIEGSEDTIAFGFNSSMSLVRSHIKRKVSGNLDENTGAENSEWTFISITAKKLVLRNGEKVKLLITGIEDE